MTWCEGGSVRKWLIIVASIFALIVAASLVLDQLSRHAYPTPLSLVRLAELAIGGVISAVGVMVHEEIGNRKNGKSKRKKKPRKGDDHL